MVENCGRDCFDVEEADEWCSIVQASHREGSRIVALLRDYLPRTALEQLQIEQIVYRENGKLPARFEVERRGRLNDREEGLDEVEPGCGFTCNC